MASYPQLGRYRLLKKIATGGMATVFLAEDPKTGNPVAIKEILPQMAGDKEFMRRFIHEVKILLQLNHPNILPILDSQLESERPFIVMPYLDGGTLKDIAKKIKKLPADLAVYLIQEILKGLDYAHHKKIIHRDIKPSNIMLNASGAIYLTDFGIARAEGLTQLTQTGEILGTPAYMSPEQAMGKPLTPASDLFSVGVIFYELLTGHNPFQTDSPMATIRQVVELHPPGLLDLDPTIPTSLESIILRLLQKDLSKRYHSCIEVLEDILRYWTDRNPKAVKEKWMAFVADPEGHIRALRSEEARQRFSVAGELWRNPETKPQALWEVFQATRLDPTFVEALTTMEAWKKYLGSQEQTVQDPRIEELEKQWREDPSNYRILLQLGKLYRLRKDYLNLMKTYERLEQLKPQDPYTLAQMRSLLMRPKAVPPSPPQKVVTKLSVGDLFRVIPLWVYLIFGSLLLGAGVVHWLNKVTQPVMEGTTESGSLLPLQEGGVTPLMGSETVDLAPALQKEKNGDVQGAYQAFQNIITLNPDITKKPMVLFHYGRIARKMGKIEEAIENLNTAYAKMAPPDRWHVGLELALAYLDNLQIPEAENLCDTVLTYGNDQIKPRALLVRAKVYKAKQWQLMAKTDLKTLLEDYPDSPEAEEARALLETLP